MNKKVALVTGGSQGIGLATVKKFAEKGYVVVIGDVKKEQAQKIAEHLTSIGNTVDSIFCDVSKETSIKGR